MERTQKQLWRKSFETRKPAHNRVGGLTGFFHRRGAPLTPRSVCLRRSFSIGATGRVLRGSLSIIQTLFTPTASLFYFMIRLVNYYALPPYRISNNLTFGPSFFVRPPALPFR